MSAIATYGEWMGLSDEHKQTQKEISELICRYERGNSISHYAQTVVGVFGSGKTQLLYHIHNQCLQEGILPIYLEADRLLNPVFELESPGPGDVTDTINERIAEIENALAQNNTEKVHNLLNPGNDAEKEPLIENTLEQFGGEKVEKKAILVDELEQQYESLQEHVRADENSPLRDWLERRNELKFLALAPAGMYEMGGADRTRCGRIVIPPVDVNYLRDEYFDTDVGLANACWWLSRGNPRHILNNAEKLNRRDNIHEMAPYKISNILTNLDPIGQEPSVVPAVNVDEIDRKQLSEILDLAPQEAETQRRYVIDADEADQAEFIERVADTFEVDRKVADYLARYFFLVANTLSNEDNVCYVDDLNGLFALAIDFLLEYQHKNPDIQDGIREVTEAYEQLDSTKIDATIGRLFEFKETSKSLPVSTDTIREAFRLPIVDPIVRNHTIETVEETYEGEGRPLWMIEKHGLTVYFFISERDFVAYTQSDEFLDAALPDGNTVLCLVAESVDEIEDERNQWLKDNGKLAIETTSPLLSDFLTSLAGELEKTPPVSLTETLDELADSDDPILERKVRIYEKSLNRLIIGAQHTPNTFCEEDVPHTHVWGQDQIGNRQAVIPAVAQAYREQLNDENVRLLAELGSLFESGGVLNFLAKERSGYVTVAKDLLPLHKREYEHQQVIKNLHRYFNNEQELRTLAQLVTEDTFRKLAENENKDRLLTAFWRATRDEFQINDLEKNLNWIDQVVIDRLEDAVNLSSAVSTGPHSATLDFDSEREGRSYEPYMTAQNNDAFQELYDLTDECLTNGDLLTQKLFSMYLAAVRDKDQTIRQLGGWVDTAQNELDKFEKAATDLEENLWEYEKARQFAGVTEAEIESVLEEQSLTGTVNIDQLDEEIESRRKEIKKYSRKLKSINRDLDEMAELFNEIAEMKPELEVQQE